MQIQTPWYKSYKIAIPAGMTIFLLAVMAGWLLWPQTAAAWYTGGAGTWDYRLKITINASQVSANLTDFPVYVDLNDLPASFFDNVQAGGGDIRVTAADGSTEVPREIVSIDTGTDSGELHFKAPSLSSTTNTEFYIYFGNSSAPDYADGDTYGTHNVWSNNFAAVWHMSTGNVVDSTSNNNDGTDFGTSAATGLVGSARQFNPAESDYIEVPDSPSLRVPMPMTVTTLYRFNSVTGSFPRLYDKGVNGSSTFGYSHLYSVNNSRHEGRYGTGAASNNTLSNVATTAGAWETYAQVLDSGSQELFVNGTSAATSSYTDAIAYNTTALRIGGATNNASSQYFDGLIDELRISSVARSAGWISTEDNNLKSASTFYTVGSQEQDPQRSRAGETTIQANSKGLVAHYSLGDNFEAKDRTPNENHGTVNGATLTTDRHGHANGAYSFAGNSIDLGTGEALVPGEHFTLSAWIYPNHDGSQTFNGFLGGEGPDVPTTRSPSLFIDRETGLHGGFGGGGSWNSFRTDLGVITENTWNFVTLTYDGSYMRVYVDGQQVLEQAETDIPSPTPIRYIGQVNGGTQFTGKIDEVRIYNRALSVAEIESLRDSYNPGLYINDLQKGLVGNWGLGEGFEAKDRTPHSNNGTVSGAILTADRHGHTGGAYSFDGVDDFIALPDIDLPATITVSAWVNPSSPGGKIVGKHSGTTDVQGTLGYSGNARFEITVNGVYYSLESGAVPEGAWAHFAATYDGSAINLYVNGQLADSATASGPIANNNFGWAIGRLNAGASSGYFNGGIDDARIYNRALSAEEVESLHDSYNPGLYLN